jgi:hypothetical protein
MNAIQSSWSIVPPGQAMQEEIKNINRDERDAIEQERLERVGPDLGVTALVEK